MVAKYKISGNSMYPTLKPGTTVLISRLPYFFKSPKTADIVVIKDPRSKRVLVKRISKVKQNKYFVVGDNSSASTDSRVFGWIEKKDIIGKVILA